MEKETGIPMKRSSFAVSGVILLCIGGFLFVGLRVKHGRFTAAEIIAQRNMEVAGIVVLVIAILLLLRAVFLNRKIQFSIRDLLWLTLVVALCLAWWRNRQQFIEEREKAAERVQQKMHICELIFEAVENTPPDAFPELKAEMGRAFNGTKDQDKATK
jgi:hypothetical protein